MNARSAIAKGKELENHILEHAEKIFSNARRNPGSGNGKKKSDVVFGEWSCEAKNTKNFNWKEAADQVRRDAMGYSKEAVIWHKAQTPLNQSVAIINIQDFFELLAQVEKHKGRDEILDKYQVKNNLTRSE